MIWIQFLATALVIVFAGVRLARYGDVLGEKSGLGRSWIGVVLLAATTSLPELFTGFGATALANLPDIARKVGARIRAPSGLASADSCAPRRCLRASSSRHGPDPSGPHGSGRHAPAAAKSTERTIVEMRVYGAHTSFESLHQSVASGNFRPDRGILRDRTCRPISDVFDGSDLHGTSIAPTIACIGPFFELCRPGARS